MRLATKRVAGSIAVAAIAIGTMIASPATAATLNNSRAAPGALGAAVAVNLVTTTSGGGYTTATNSQSTYLVGAWLPAHVPRQLCNPTNKFRYSQTGTYVDKIFGGTGSCSYYVPLASQYKQWDPPALRTGSSYCSGVRNSMTGGNWSADVCVGVQ